MNQSINLNLIPDGVKPVAKVSQFDVGRVVTFALYQGPDVYTPPAGTTLEFRELKSDKHICVYDDAATLSGSTITLETTQQMTAAAGEALCQFKLTNGTEVLATLNFWLDVQTDPAAEGDISDSDIPGIIALATEQMERAEAAADSAAANAESAADSKEDAETAATRADASATAAEGSAEDAEAYAVGTRGGADVPSTDPAYQNNSKYYSDLASAWAAHPPYVGANGDWYVYDPATQQFVDTGIDASITMQIQDVTMLPYGTNPTVNNIGTSTDAIFRLGIPRAATVSKIEKTSSSGLVDTYTITMQDGATFNFTVTNGADGGGHVIENSSGQNMPARNGLQFTGGVTVSDDSTNDRTVIQLPIEMLGASSLTAGARGLVPAPAAGDEGKFLRGDGTWAEAGGGGTTIVQKPTVAVGTYTYDGTAQGPTITGLDTDHCTVTNAKKIDAGTYTLTISLKNTSTMVWSDLTTADITAEYTIAKKGVTIPTVSGSFTYDGTEKTATIGSTGDSAYWTQGGTVSATNAGTYTVTFDLNDLVNTKWSDDTTAQKSGSWTIAKAEQTIQLSKNSVTLDVSALYDTVTVALTAGDGALSATSNDTSIATATLSNGSIRIDAVNNGTTTVVVAASETANYEAKTATISVTVALATDLDDASWATISAAAQDGTASSQWDVGDCKGITVNGTIGTLSINQKLYVFILGFNHNSNVEGVGIQFGCFKTAKENGIDVALCDSNYGSNKSDGTKAFNMNHWGGSSNPYNTNYGGWKGCDARYDILGSTKQAPSGYGSTPTTSRVGYDAASDTATSPVSNTLMAALPSDLRNVMKPITKYTDNTGNSSTAAANVTSSVDYLPLLAEYEIHGANTYANTNEASKQVQYKYFENGNSKIKYNHSSTASAVFWWSRSPRSSNADNFCTTNASGTAFNTTSRHSYGVAPAFRV